MTSWRRFQDRGAARRRAGPELAHDGGGVLEVFDGLEEGDGLEAGVGGAVVGGWRGFDLTPPRRASARTLRQSSAEAAPLMT